MSVDVLLFAAAREAVGTERLQLNVSEDATVSDVLADLAQQHPALAAVLPSCRAAVNEQFARQETPVPAGSVVAILPPVSGG